MKILLLSLLSTAAAMAKIPLAVLVNAKHKTVEIRTAGRVSCAGVIIKRHVLTAAHCLNPGQDFMSVRIGDKIIPAKVKKERGDLDLALLELYNDRPNRFPVRLARKVHIGDEIFAIGHPFRERFSYSFGQVTLFKKRGCYRFSARCVKVDAALNPGNSGGGVFNIKGELIGIVSHGKQGEQSGGYAISLYDIKRFLKGVK